MLKLTIIRDVFLGAAKRCASIAAKDGKTHPVYASMLVRAMPGQPLECSATDLETGIVVRVAATIEESGLACIPAAQLAQLLSKLPDGELSLTVDPDNHKATIKAGRGVYSLGGQSPSEFPEIPSVAAAGVVLPGKRLAEAIGRVIHAVSMEAQRYALKGARLTASDGRVEFVASDGRRLALDVAEASGAASWSAIVPPDALREIAKLAADAESVTLDYSRNHFSASTPDATIITRTLEGQFPNIAEVVKMSGGKNRLVVPREEFMAALDRASLVDEKSCGTVALEFAQASTLVISSRSEAGEVREEIAVDYAGSALRIGFQAAFVLDVLRACPGESAVLDFGNASMPMRLVDGTQTQIVMPVTLDVA